MGWNNAWLLRALEKARKKGDSSEQARLSKLVDESQERCKHVGPRGSQTLKEDSKNGKYRKGGLFSWCLLCGKKTDYVPPSAR